MVKYVPAGSESPTTVQIDPMFNDIGKFTTRDFIKKGWELERLILAGSKGIDTTVVENIKLSDIPGSKWKLMKRSGVFLAPITIEGFWFDDAVKVIKSHPVLSSKDPKVKVNLEIKEIFLKEIGSEQRVHIKGRGKGTKRKLFIYMLNGARYDDLSYDYIACRVNDLLHDGCAVHERSTFVDSVMCQMDLKTKDKET